MTANELDDYSYEMSTVFGCNSHCRTKVANVALPKSVLSTAEILAVYG